MLSKADTPTHQPHQQNVRRNVTQHIFDIPFEQLVVSKVSLQVLTVPDEFQGRHEIGELFDGRVSDLFVNLVQLLCDVIFVNFFQGFVGSLFDVLCRVFDLSLGD